MAEPLEIPLYGNLYVGDGTKEALLAVWETIITNTGVRIHTNERVQTVQKNGTGFYIETGEPSIMREMSCLPWASAARLEN